MSEHMSHSEKIIEWISSNTWWKYIHANLFGEAYLPDLVEYAERSGTWTAKILTIATKHTKKEWIEAMQRHAPMVNIDWLKDDLVAVLWLDTEEMLNNMFS